MDSKINKNVADRAARLLGNTPGGKEILKDGGINGVTTPPPPEAPKPPASINTAPAPKEDYDFGETPSEKDSRVPVEPKKDVPAESPKDVQPPKEEAVFVPEDPTDEDGDLEGEIDPKANHAVALKAVRDKFKKTKKERNQLRTELEETRKKLQEFEEGSAVPEVMSSLQRRVSELEPYEKLHNFKGSEVYRKTFAEPIRESQEKLKTLAIHAEVDVDVLNKAFNAANDVEANRILTNAFKDPLTAAEAKSLIKGIKNTQDAALQAEKDAETSFAQLTQKNDAIEAERKGRIFDAVNYNSKKAWSEGLKGLREDGRFPELVFQEGNSEHNDRVRALLTKASQEYGKIMAAALKHGIQELPEELGVAIARMSNLAHVSAAVAVERDALMKEVAELRAQVDRLNRVNYPGVNRAAGTPAPQRQTIRGNPQAAGERALARVTGGNH